MAGLKQPAVGIDVDRPEADRLSADDQAARRALDLVGDALNAHRARQERRGVLAQPGLCSNCGEICAPLAVYCDDECKLDHETRETALRRTRRAHG